MKNVKTIAFFITAFFLSANLYSQTLEEIISKHIDALGGKEKLGSITSVRLENSMEVMGNEAPSVITILNGKGYKSESEFGGQKIIQVVTDKSGWSINPMAGSSDPQTMPEDQLKASQDQIFIAPFFNYAEREGKAVLAGQEKIGTINAHKVELTTKNGGTTTYYLDPTTFLIMQTKRTASMMGQEMELTTTYTDYKKIDFGVTLPYKTEVSFGGQFSMTSNLKKVEINTPVSESVFEMKN